MKADIVRLFARMLVGFAYDWAGVIWRALSGTTDRDQLTPDCSGLVIGIWTTADVKFKKGDRWVGFKTFFGTNRPTSRSMHGKCTLIDQPSEVGDLGFRKHGDDPATTADVYHVVMYIGNGQTIEAGYHNKYFSVASDKSYSGHGYVGLDTVEWQNAHGVVWGRLPTDIGQLTPKGQKPTSPMSHWPEQGWLHVGPWTRLYKALVNQILGYTFRLKLSDETYGYYTWRKVRACRVKLGLSPGGEMDAEFVEAIQKRFQ